MAVNGPRTRPGRHMGCMGLVRQGLPVGEPDNSLTTKMFGSKANITIAILQKYIL